MRKYYANRDIYDGEFLDGLRHGSGTLFYSNGDRYSGDFQKNLFHGFGTFTWVPYKNNDDGIYYIGRRYEGASQRLLAIHIVFL